MNAHLDSYQSLYNSIGSSYNSTRQADPHIAERLIHQLVPKESGRYLDIGCGTGNYTIWLSQQGINFWGVDPSNAMLCEARQHASRDEVIWLEGTADSIPVESLFFDGGIATLTIHHWPDLTNAFQELSRVLKPGSQLILFTALPEQMERYWLNHYFPRMMEASIRQMPTLTAIIQAANDFEIVTTESYTIQPHISDLFLYAGKNEPQLYLDTVVRRGISSFSSVAYADEVVIGLDMLRNDIKDRTFEQVKLNYETTLGDYLFVVMQRN
jgi:ubiquinone/menaquinone biosynthesis C-methylase UbiE